MYKMATNGGYINVNVTLGSGKLVAVAVSPELYGHFRSTDPNLKNMAKQLIIQAAIEQDSNDDETEEEGLPDIPPPVPQPPENSSNNNNQSPAVSNGIFTKEQILFIISGYKDRKAKFLSPTYKKKTLWMNITEELNKAFSTNFSVGQVEGRWKTQLSAYKRHQTDQGKSGQERKDFPYEEEFQDIMMDRHDINPQYVAGSLSTNSSSTDEPGTSASEPGICESPKPKKKRKNLNTNSTQALKFLEDFAENQNKKNEENMEKIERMHKEKMEIFSGFLSVLKNMKD